MTGYLRFILATFVAAFHLGYNFFGIPLGPPAVIIFYVLAGFVVCRLLTEIFSGQPLSSFFAERALRIFPTYLFCSSAAGPRRPLLSATIRGQSGLFSGFSNGPRHHLSSVMRYFHWSC